jgi:hypothetical protein
MKLNQFSNASRPRIATFNAFEDEYDIVITEEPKWTEDLKDATKEVLEVVGQDDRSIYWKIIARTQMPDAVFDAITEAGVEEILVGGRLRVRYVDNRGQTKIYQAWYTPPDDSEAVF